MVLGEKTPEAGDTVWHQRRQKASCVDQAKNPEPRPRLDLLVTHGLQFLYLDITRTLLALENSTYKVSCSPLVSFFRLNRSAGHPCFAPR